MDFKYLIFGLLLLLVSSSATDDQGEVSATSTVEAYTAERSSGVDGGIIDGESVSSTTIPPLSSTREVAATVRSEEVDNLSEEANPSENITNISPDLTLPQTTITSNDNNNEAQQNTDSNSITSATEILSSHADTVATQPAEADVTSSASISSRVTLSIPDPEIETHVGATTTATPTTTIVTATSESVSDEISSVAPDIINSQSTIHLVNSSTTVGSNMATFFSTDNSTHIEIAIDTLAPQAEIGVPTTSAAIGVPTTSAAIGVPTTVTFLITEAGEIYDSIDDINDAIDVTVNSNSSSPAASATAEGNSTEPSSAEQTRIDYCSLSLYNEFIGVVAAVLVVQFLFCGVTTYCVYRVVRKHHYYSWDPPPIRYGSVDYGISMGRRNMGLDLSPETPDGTIPPPPRVTHDESATPPINHRNSASNAGIPIVITNEDGWCVPYSEAEKGNTQHDDTHDTHHEHHHLCNITTREDKNRRNEEPPQQHNSDIKHTEHQMQQRQGYDSTIDVRHSGDADTGV